MDLLLLKVSISLTALSHCSVAKSQQKCMCFNALLLCFRCVSCVFLVRFWVAHTCKNLLCSHFIKPVTNTHKPTANQGLSIFSAYKLLYSLLACIVSYASLTCCVDCTSHWRHNLQPSHSFLAIIISICRN